MIGMHPDNLKKLLLEVQNGSVSIDAALNIMKDLPFEDLGFAVVDHHRALRKGYPEVIFCQGKTIPQIEQDPRNHSNIRRQVL